MKQRISAECGYHITGHRLSASYSAAKLLWIKDNEPEVYNKADKMLNAKDYIIYRLTGEIVTDYSDASGTNLLDIEKKEWSDELINAFGIHQQVPIIYYIFLTYWANVHLDGMPMQEAALLGWECLPPSMTW